MRGFAPAETQEEKLFVKRVAEAVLRCENGAEKWVSPFLDERQQQLALAQLSKLQWRKHLFFGGHSNAERKVLAVFCNDFCEESAYVNCVQISCHKSEALTHRDFLGALMSLGLKREVIGDILVWQQKEKSGATVFLTPIARQTVVNELCTVGKAAVSVECNVSEPIMPNIGQAALCAHTSVQSLRFDAVLGAALHKSREIAAECIRAGSAAVNARVIVSPHYAMQQGDIIAVRGVGKFCLATVGGKSKKDRIFIEIQKF